LRDEDEDEEDTHSDIVANIGMTDPVTELLNLMTKEKARKMK